MNDFHMTSYRPYLLRALYEWIADNGMTPHILVDASVSGVRVPKHAIGDGRVVLNIAERAVAKLQMDNERISFSARFGGAPQQVLVPVEAVLAIYARETGQGMALPADAGNGGQPPAQQPAPPPRPPALAAVPGADGAGASAAAGASPPDSEDGTDTPPPAPSSPPKRGRAHLRVVK